MSHCDGLSEEVTEDICYTYTRVYNNLVRDGWPYFCCANWLYNDVSASKTLFENNIVHGSGSEAIIHHCGLENESKNNYVHRIVSPSNGQEPIDILWGFCEANQGKLQSFTDHHNIYFFEDTEDFALYKSYNYFDERSVFSDNLYFSLVPEDEFKGMFPPDNIPFADLPSVGSERNQWADPKFEDPAINNYQLAEDSPAFGMGIKQIRLDNFGIQANKRPFYL